MSRVKGLSHGKIRQMAILGSVLVWIGCDRGVEVTPPAVTSEAGVAEASAIPNITSSIFQNQSFECLNEVYTTSQNVRQSVPFQKDFSNCRFLAAIAEEFLGGSPTNRGHVFSREALENPASDTFGEYRNEVINPNSAANSDLSASQRAQSELSGRCSATEEIKVKRIEPTPGALRIVPPGCKDASGNQLEYAFSLVFCCPKPVTLPPTPSPTPVSLLDQGVCAVIGEAGLPSILKGAGRTFFPAEEVSVATRPLSGGDLLSTLPPFIQDAVRQNSEILFFVKKRFGTDLNTKKLTNGFEIEFLEKRSLATPPLSDLLTSEAKGFAFDAQGQIKASGGARSSHLPTEQEIFLFTMMGVNGIEGIGIAFRNTSTGKLNIKTLFFEPQPSVLILAEQPPGFGGFTFPSIAFGCGNLKP